MSAIDRCIFCDSCDLRYSFHTEDEEIVFYSCHGDCSMCYDIFKNKYLINANGRNNLIKNDIWFAYFIRAIDKVPILIARHSYDTQRNIQVELNGHGDIDIANAKDFMKFITDLSKKLIENECLQ